MGDIKCLSDELIQDLSSIFTQAMYDDISNDVLDGKNIVDSISSRYNEFVSNNEGIFDDEIATAEQIKNGNSFENKNKLINFIISELKDVYEMDIDIQNEALLLSMFPDEFDNVSSESSDLLSLQLDLSHIFAENSEDDVDRDEREMYGSLMALKLSKDLLLGDYIYNNLMVKNRKIVSEPSYRLNLFEMKLSLLKNIVDVLSDKPTAYSKIKNENVSFNVYTKGYLTDYINKMLSIINDRSKSRDQKISEISNNMKYIELNSVFDLFKSSYPNIDISTLSRRIASESAEDAVFIKAYNSLFILRNLNTILSEKVKICDVISMNSNIIKLDYIKTKDKYSNIIKGWQEDNEERGAFQEANNIVKFMLNANYRYRNKTKTNDRLGVDMFNYAIGMLNKMINRVMPNTEISKGGISFFGNSSGEVYNLSKLFIDMFEKGGNGFYNILKMVGNKYDYNGSERFFEDILVEEYNKTGKKMSNEEALAFKDGLYSIKKAFEDLYEACKECTVDITIPNYFNFIAQYANMVGRNDYLALSTDKNGNFYMKNLSKNNTDLAKRRIESSINISKNTMINELSNMESMDNDNDNFSTDIRYHKIPIVDVNGNPTDMFNMIPIAIYKNMNVFGEIVSVVYDYTKGEAFIINEGEMLANIDDNTITNVLTSENKLTVKDFIANKIKGIEPVGNNAERMGILRSHMKIVTRQNFDSSGRLFNSYAIHFGKSSGEGIDYSNLVSSTYENIFDILSLSFLSKTLKEEQDGITDMKLGITNVKSMENKLFGNGSFSVGNETYIPIRMSTSGHYTRPDAFLFGVMAVSTKQDAFMNYVTDAVSYSENMITRDTVKNKANDQLPVSGLRRFMNVEGTQFREIAMDKTAAMSVNPITMSTMDFTEMMKREIAKDMSQDERLVKVKNEILDKLTEMNIGTVNTNIYKGSSLIRESEVGGNIKKHSKFNLNECFSTEFFINYLESMYNSNDQMLLTLSINSDKSTNNLVGIDMSFINFLRSLNEDESNYVISTILRNMYKKRYDNIVEDLGLIRGFILDGKNNLDGGYNRVLNDNPYWATNFDKAVAGMLRKAVEENYLDDEILSEDDYKKNFTATNKLMAYMATNSLLASSSPELIMSSIVKMRNMTKAPGERDVRIIDSTYFANRKKEFGLTNNPILLGRLQRYSNEDLGFRSNFNGSYDSDVYTYCNKDFFSNINMMLMYYLVSNDMVMNTSNDSGYSIKIESIKNKVDDAENPFYDYKGVSFMTIKFNRIIYNIRSLQDFRSMVADIIASDPNNTIEDVSGYIDSMVSSSTEFKSFMESLAARGAEINYNNDLTMFNKIQFLASMLYQEGTIGGSFNHPIKGSDPDLFTYEAKATGSVNKRNVSLTASTHPLELNTLDGFSHDIYAACIDDIKEEVSNYFGATSTVSSHDGMSVLSPTATIMFNNSLCGDSASYVLKPFIHYQDFRTGSGAIIKTAAFGLTNQTMRSFHNGDIMAYKTMGFKWADLPFMDGQTFDIFNKFNFRCYDAGQNKTSIFNFISRKYGGIYERSGNGTYKKINSIERNADGTYTRTVDILDRNGNRLGTNIKEDNSIRIESNYDLWKALGGMYSCTYDVKAKKFRYAETSIFATVDVINSNMVVVENINGKDVIRPVKDYNEAMLIQGQDNTHIQFMKHGNADLVITEGAIKQGLFNVNRHQDFFFNKDGLISTSRISLKYGGINLDASHDADNSHVSEMTQVMSALGSNGFTKEIAQNVYEAAAQLSSRNIVKYVQGIVEHVKKLYGEADISYKVGDENKYINDITANFIVKTMVDKGSFTDEMRLDCKPLMDKVSKGGYITYKDLEGVLSLTNPSFLNQAFPALASFINKNSIKKQFDGTLSVMNPSKGLVSIFGNMKFGSLGVTDDEKVNKLRNIQSKMDSNEITINDFYKIKMGHRYTVYDADMRETEFCLESYNDYEGMRKFMANTDEAFARETVIKDITGNENADLNSKSGIIIRSNNRTYLAKGRDLAPMNITVTNTTGGFNLYDLNSVKDIFDIQNIGKNIDINTIINGYSEYFTDDERIELSNLSQYDSTDVYKKYFVLGRILDRIAKIPDVSFDDTVIDNTVVEINHIGAMAKRAINFRNMIINHIRYVAEYRRMTDLSLFNNDMNSAMRYLYDNMNLDDIVRQSINIDLEKIDRAKNGESGLQVHLYNGADFMLTGISVNTEQYEAMSPNVNKSKYGIDDDVEMDEIDRMYFFKKMLSRRFTMIGSEKYSYALVRGSGNNTYIYHRKVDSEEEIEKRLGGAYEINDLDDRIIFKNGKKYRINPDSKTIMYEIPEGSRFFILNENGRDNDIIVTNDPSTLIKSSSFYDFIVSPNEFMYNKNEMKEDESIEGIKNDIMLIVSSASSQYDKDKHVLGKEGRSAKYVYEAEDIFDPLQTKLESSIDFSIEQARRNVENNSDNGLGNYSFSTIMESVDKGVRDSGGFMEYLNGNPNINPAIKSLMKTADEIYQSFVSSCRIMAARIPSQNQQSFMSMKIALFDNSGLNNAYVNSMQQWLQGSDYDIDKVTFLMYAIDGSGKFIGWSPLFDYSRLFESMELPLPNGREAKIINRGDPTDMEEYEMDIYKRLRNEIIVPKNNDYGIDMSDMKKVARFINLVNEFGIIQFDGDDVKMNEYIKNLVDIHNKYLDKPTDRNMKAIKNYYLKNMIDVSENLKNMMESLSSVDDNKDIKTASGLDKNVEKRQKESYANVVTTFMQFDDNMVGKDGIGIIAATLKNFFAIQHAFNIHKVKSMKDLLDVTFGRGFDGVNINGKTYRVVANYNPDAKTRRNIAMLLEDENIEKSVRDKILDIYNDTALMFMKKDASISISGLLGEAADNAKNLNLAKMNASTNTLSQIIFGITIGMDFNEIIRVMISKNARTVDRLMKGNIFTGDGKDIRFDDIYNNIYKWGNGYYNGNFYQFGNTYELFIDNSDKSFSIEYKLNTLLKQTGRSFSGDSGKDARINLLNESVGTTISDKIKSLSGTIGVSSADLYTYYKYFNTRFRYIPGVSLDAPSNVDLYISKFKEDMSLLIPNNRQYQLWVERMANDIANNYSFVSDRTRTLDILKQLNDGANEMKKSGVAVGLNKGVKQTRSKLASFNENVRNLVKADARKQINIGIDFSNTQDFNKYLGLETGFSYQKYLEDHEYRDRVDSYENKTRYAFNPIKIGQMLPHVSSYIDIYNTTNNMLKSGISKKNKIIEDFFGKVMFEVYKGVNVSSSYKESVIANCASFIDGRVFDSFLRKTKFDGKNEGFRFVLPEGFSYYINGRLTKNKNNKKFYMKLGTPDSNMTFIKLMNEVIIPQLMQGYKIMNDKSSKRLFVSDFLKGLTPMEYQSPLTGAIIDVYTMGIDRMSNSESDIAKVNTYKSMMDLLSKQYFSFGKPRENIKTEIKYRISDLLYIYNSLIFSSSNNKYSMESYFSTTNTPVISLYNDFTLNFDYESVIPNIDKIKDTNYFKRLCCMLSPVVKYVNEDSPTFIKKLDKKNTMQIKMYKVNKDKKSDRYTFKKNEQGYDDENEDFNIGDEGLTGFYEDESMGQDIDNDEFFDGEQRGYGNNNRKGFSLEDINSADHKQSFFEGQTLFNESQSDGISLFIDAEEYKLRTGNNNSMVMEHDNTTFIVDNKELVREIDNTINTMRKVNDRNTQYMIENIGKSEEDMEGIKTDARYTEIKDMRGMAQDIISKFENNYSQKDCQ